MKIVRRVGSLRMYLLPLLYATLFLVGCAHPDDNMPPMPDLAAAPSLVAVAVSPSNPSIAKGTQQQFSATATFSDGSMQDVSQLVSWSATDVAPAANVATITSAGLASGKSEGQALVGATFMGKSGMTKLTVTAAVLSGLAVSPQNPSIANGTTQQFTATGTFSDGSMQDLSAMVTWTAADVAPAVNVATITSVGLATGKSAGQATISAMLMNKTASTRLTVTAAALSAIAVSPQNPSIAKGTTQQFTATGMFSDGSMQDVSVMVSWSATDVAPAVNVATLSSSGLATGKNLGQATITASLMGKSGSTKLTVTAAVLSAIAVSPSNPSIAKGTTQQFTAKATFSDGSTQDVSSMATWSATDVAPATDVAAISSTGLATAKNLGQATIAASFMGKSDSTKLTVTAATVSSIAVSPSNPSIAKGTTQQFTATATFSDGSMQDVSTMVSWSATDLPPAHSVATITSAGLATAKNLGQATIAAALMGKTGLTQLTVTAAVLTGVAVSPTAPSTAKGTTQQFTATATFSDASTQDVTGMATWTATDVAPAMDVATITSGGLATAKNLGQTTIAAAFMGKSGSTQLTVTAALLTSIAVTPANPSIAKGLTQQFTATGTFSDGSTQDVSSMATWTATDVAPAMNVATISSGGLATAKSLGQATIAASLMGKTDSTKLTVTAAVLSTITVSPANPSVAKGSFQPFTATATLSDGSMQDVTSMAMWSATDIAPAMNVAAVNSSGLATAKNLGQATIAAALMGKSGSTALTVTAPVPSTLRLSPANPAVDKGASEQLSAYVVYTDGSTMDVTAMATWSATDIAPASGVATISSGGLVSTGNLGRSTLGAVYMGLSGSTILTVHTPGVFCSADKWCWRNPFPGGPNLNAVWESGVTGTIWAVGYSGAIVTWSSGSGVWNTQTSGTTKTLYAVWGTSTSNIWAVGEAGTILLWNGSTWSAQVSGTTATLTKVWGSDATHVWAIGDTGTILQWDGSMWRKQTSGTTTYLRGIWGLDASQIWAVGDNGTILKWDGTSWKAQPSFSMASLVAIWGSDSSHVWVTGYGGTVLQWDGTSWGTQTSGTSDDLFGVWGSDATHLVAVASSGAILTGDGASWSILKSGPYSYLSGVWISDASHIWLAGGRRGVARWNGTSWTDLGTDIMYYPFNAIWGADASHVWAVGYDGLMGFWNGSTWTARTGPGVYDLYGIWGTAADNIWAFDSLSRIYHFDGSSWGYYGSVSYDLYAAWGTDAKNIWAVGNSGYVSHWDGTKWSPQSTGTSYNLRAVWGADTTHVWAAGYNGIVLKWDGSSWSEQSVGVSNNLLGIWGSDSRNVWIVGAGGTIVKWDGSAWRHPSSGTTSNLTGIWGNSASSIWVTTASGAILKWDGSAWSSQVSGATNLNAIWGSEDGHMWTVGANGTVLEHAP